MSRHAISRFGLTPGRNLLLAAALVIGAGVAWAANQPDQLVTGKKLIVKTNTGDTTKNKVVYVSKDTSFQLPDVTNDPTVAGASVQVADLGGGAGSITIPLPAAGWKAISNGFKFKDANCKAKIKGNKLIKVVCKGSSVALAPPFTGPAAIALTAGTASVRYCTTFDGTPTKNAVSGSGKGTYKHKDITAPIACFGSSELCGNGTLNPGEDCDDGNIVGGDCCSSTCTFESNGSSCSDGNACTVSDACNGAGSCTGAPACGNDIVDAGCGEQCDGTSDGACPGRCLGDCTCLPEPTCDGDPSRVVFAGGPETGACHDFDGNQTVCNQAFILGDGGVASCYYDTDTDECSGCGPHNQADGVCMNTCRPVTCVGDPSRTMFAGGPQTSACQEFGITAGTANCQFAFHIGQYGVASCFYDANDDECKGCGPENQDEGNCVNTCAACQADPTRTIFVGGPGTEACHEFDGDEASCNQAFHRDQCGNDTSCYYDGFSCNGCGVNNQQDGVCLNTCETGPSNCTNDPSRTIDAGGPGTGACHQFDGDPANCQLAFHHTDSQHAASCFYDFSADECRGCGPSNEFDGACINTCVAGPVTCPLDPSRTFLAGLPGSQGCQEFGQSAGTAACETAFNIGASGVTSCFTDGFDCMGCGPPNEGNGECINTCTEGPPSCAADPTRTIYAGGPQTSACHQFDGDQSSCEQAFHLGAAGIASCYYDSGSCNGCGPSNQANGYCTNTCNPPSCPGDPTRVVFTGGPNTGACHVFDGDQTNCEKSYHLGSNGSGVFAASCYYDTNTDECSGCGPNNQEAGNCLNTCPVCANDPSRTVFAGGPGTGACQDFVDQASCESAFHYDTYGRPTSCYWNGSCQGCGPNNFANGECRNTCVTGPPTCDKDSSRTIFAGGPQTAACHQYDGNPESCLQAFHMGNQGGIASCFYDSGGSCNGCGAGNVGNGECLNTCQNGVPACPQDPGRALFAGYPNTSACHIFDGDPSGCADAYHLDQYYNPASCFFDTDSNECRGCGPNNEQDGACVNTCKNGPASCDGDSARVLFGGGPGTGACQQYGDPITCLAAFHIGQCGVASCYWDGGGCSGCGPSNEFNGNCFNTCQAPE